MKPVFLLGKMMAQDETSGKTSISGKINERLIKKYSIYNRRRKFQHNTLYSIGLCQITKFVPICPCFLEKQGQMCQTFKKLMTNVPG
jgi:hypothetical protein